MAVLTSLAIIISLFFLWFNITKRNVRYEMMLGIHVNHRGGAAFWKIRREGGGYRTRSQVYTLTQGCINIFTLFSGRAKPDCHLSSVQFFCAPSLTMRRQAVVSSRKENFWWNSDHFTKMVWLCRHWNAGKGKELCQVLGWREGGAWIPFCNVYFDNNSSGYRNRLKKHSRTRCSLELWRYFFTSHCY